MPAFGFSVGVKRKPTLRIIGEGRLTRPQLRQVAEDYLADQVFFCAGRVIRSKDRRSAVVVLEPEYYP